MAKNTVPVNFKDDILNASMGGKRRYKLINNSDGTVSLEDVSKYDQIGNDFGQAQINATNTAVNESADKNRIIDSLSAIASNTQSGYMAGALAVKELNSNLTYNQNTDITINTSVLNAYQSVSARRSVNTVTLKIFGALATYAQNKEYKVATIINENIKPIETVYLTAPMVSGAAVSTGTCMVSIKTNGDVTIMPQQSDCNWIYAHVTFVI